jgi:hypothetical protein
MYLVKIRMASREIVEHCYLYILNFAIDLELLGKIGQQIVITPAGFRFILMLQCIKALKLIESMTTK